MDSRPPPSSDLPHVDEYAEACVRAVERSLAIRLDYAPETLPLLDHYVVRLPDRPRRATRDPVRGLVAVLTGVYFGEVVRRAFPARWAFDGVDPASWRVEFTHCFLTFRPVGVAWEVILQRDLPGHAATYVLEDGQRDRLVARLDSLPRAPVADYFTFSQRLETLVLLAGWLAEEARAAGEPGDAPVEIPTSRYVALLGRLGT